MSRFLICSFALVLLYPAGIDMYLVGLPRIAADLNASEAQLHIAFSVYLAGMAAAMLFAGKVADRSGRKPVAIPGAALFIIASVFCSLAETSTLFLAGRFLGTAAKSSVYFCLFGGVPPSDGILSPARSAAPGAISAPECSAAQGEQSHCPEWVAGRRHCKPGTEGTTDALSHLCYVLYSLKAQELFNSR